MDSRPVLPDSNQRAGENDVYPRDQQQDHRSDDGNRELLDAATHRRGRRKEHGIDD